MNLASLVLFATPLGLPVAPTPQGSEAAQLVLRDVTLFDVREGTRSPGRTVVVRNGAIAAILENGAAEPDAESVLEGAGRLLVPGFVDTHVHLSQVLGSDASGGPELLDDDAEEAYVETLRTSFLAHGTTTIQDMGMRETWLLQALDWSLAGAPDRPDLFVVGATFNTRHDWDRTPPPHQLQLADPDAARAKVHEYADLGIERIKLYWKLEAPELAAAVEAARDRNVAMYAHIDNNIGSLRDTLELGVRHFEHFFTLAPGILVMEDHWNRVGERSGIVGHGTIDEFAASMVALLDYIDATPELRERFDELVGDMAERKASLSTTLHVLAASAGRGRPFSSFERFPERDAPTLPNYDDERRRILRGAFDGVLRLVRSAHEAGVTLRIGTDCHNGGAALLSELELLVEAGIPLADVLRIATWNGATALGLDDRGAVEVGRKADLVLFDADPFEDPANLRRGLTVVKDGVVLGG